VEAGTTRAQPPEISANPSKTAEPSQNRIERILPAMSSPRPNTTREPKPDFAPRGLATGIGSLPHIDAAEAVGLVFERLPEFPFWPQLPRRSLLEGMTLQYLEGFPGVQTAEVGGDSVVDTGESGLQEIETFYAKILSEDPEHFAVSPERAPGFYAFEEALVQSRPPSLAYVKGHVTGPVTLGSSLKDLKAREIMHDETFREAVAALVAEKAVWQARRLARFGVPVVIFLDEPVMEVYGSAYSTLSRELVLSLWEPSLAALAKEGVLAGIHCCGNTDWSLLFECGADIVNFDAYHYLEKMLLYPAEASRHLSRGGVLAWGAIPTTDEARSHSALSLSRALDSWIARFAETGLDESVLRRQCLITPACGMGSLDRDLAELVLDLLTGVSKSFDG
jgi:methionine synthase II (cobalamin-independent)